MSVVHFYADYDEEGRPSLAYMIEDPEDLEAFYDQKCYERCWWLH